MTTLNKKIGMFRILEVETHSECNRRCVSCLRNSIPDRESVASWFEPNSMSTDDFRRVLEQSQSMGFRGELCLSHYNEPLMDSRIVELVKIAKQMSFSKVFFGSNADFLTKELAAELDGNVDYIGFSFYMDEPMKSKRMAWVQSLFKRTTITMGKGDHMITHFSPLADVIQIGKRNQGNPCNLPQKRMIINHRGQMLLCCEDVTGHYDLGTIHDHTMEELWYGDNHQKYVLGLMHAGGRTMHPHCVSCPRP